jgi:hypothetical protein
MIGIMSHSVWSIVFFWWLVWNELEEVTGWDQVIV